LIAAMNAHDLIICVAGLFCMGVLTAAAAVGLIVWIAGWRNSGVTQAWRPDGKS
jgi:hypothetical protein